MEAELELMPIETEAKAKPAPSTAVAVVTLKEAALAKFSKTEADLRELAERYKDVAFDVTTPKGMKDAKAARQELRQGRYAVQRIEESTKDELNDLKRDLKTTAERLVGIVKPTEDAVDKQIVAHETAIREAAEREAARKKAHTENIATIVAWPQRAHGQPIEKLASAIAFVEGMDVSAEVYEEFAPAAEKAKADTLAELRKLHADAVESARIKAENEQRERTIRQVAAINAHVAKGLEEDSTALKQRLVSLRALLVDGVADEVTAAYETAVASLETMRDRAARYEAMERRIAEEARAAKEAAGKAALAAVAPIPSPEPEAPASEPISGAAEPIDAGGTGEQQADFAGVGIAQGVAEEGAYADVAAPLPWPNPTEADLADPEFEAIWQVIKSWDISVPGYEGVGYCGGNGSHVMLILNALRAARA